MDEREYLERLARGLRGLDRADEALAEIGEHFSAGRAAGRGVEEIASALGEPEALARDYRGAALSRGAGDRPGILDSAWLALYAVLKRLPDGRAAAAAALLGLLALAAFLAFGFLAFGGLGGVAELALGTERLSLGLPAPPAARILASLGLFFLGLGGCAGMVALLRLAGRRAGRYLADGPDPEARGRGEVCEGTGGRAGEACAKPKAGE